MKILTTILFCFLLTNISFAFQMPTNDCDPGTFFGPVNGGTPACQDCGVGTFQDESMQTECKPCEVGRFQAAEGQSTCEDCPAGRFQDQTGQANCKACLPGTYQPNPGAESCLPCELGEFQDIEGATNCKTCPPGTTTRTTGNASEDACVPVDEDLPAMNRWGLITLILLVLTAATFILRRRGLFEK